MTLQELDMSTLRLMALENTPAGEQPDVRKWPAADQRTAVYELFTQQPDWFQDALTESVGCVDSERARVLDILAHDDELVRCAALGRLFERALLDFPLDHLTELCRQHISRWRAEDERARVDTALDSAAEEKQRRREAQENACE